MLQYIYSRPPICIVLSMVVLALIWGCVCTRLQTPVRKKLNTVLFIAAVAGIAYTTLLKRVPGNYEPVLAPFAALVEAKHQPEMYRSMLMNIFLFFPVGLTLPYLLPDSFGVGKRIAATVAAGCLISIGTEFAQYSFSLGTAETDDVICNTLGTLLGAASQTVKRRAKMNGDNSFLSDKTSPADGALSQYMMTEEEKMFLDIVKAAVSDAECPLDVPDWAAVFALANEQKLLPFVFELARRSPAAKENETLFAAAKQQVTSQVLAQTMRSEQFAALYRRLRDLSLHPIVVKGRICSRLYPLRDYRISGDDDLLISDAELSACHEALLADGLYTDIPESELFSVDEIGYVKKGSLLYIELHRKLFDSSEDAHDDLNGLFVNVRTNQVDGFLTLAPHEHFLYLILHAYKHFVRSGIGIRQFLDIGLWAREYSAEIDWVLLYEQCASVHAATFASAAFTIATESLGIDFELPPPWSRTANTEPMLHDSLSGGIYGSKDRARLHTSTVTLNAVRSSRSGRKSSLISTVFPGRSYLERSYPYLKKHPALLPVAWAQRILRYADEKKGNSSDSASASLKLAKERIGLMKLYDIMD